MSLNYLSYGKNVTSIYVKIMNNFDYMFFSPLTARHLMVFQMETSVHVVHAPG